jgi:uncharacterized tellurite resistance protein B-like protein
MLERRFQRVRPLVAGLSREDGHYEILFRCPVSGLEVPVAVPQPTGRSVGRVATPQSEEVEEAVLLAFSAVEHHFAWDAGAGRYVAMGALFRDRSPLAELLSAHPVRARADRLTLARMLAEMAEADDETGPAERALFAAFTDIGTLDLETLHDYPPLTADELAATSPEARDSMLALVYAQAFSDGEIDFIEDLRAERFREGLGVDGDRADDLARIALDFVVDQALSVAFAGGRVGEEALEQARDFAHGLGLDGASFDRIEARCRRRNGVATVATMRTKRTAQ